MTITASTTVGTVPAGFATSKFLDAAEEFKVAAAFKRFADQLRAEHPFAALVRHHFASHDDGDPIDSIAWGTDTANEDLLWRADGGDAKDIAEYAEEFRQMARRPSDHGAYDYPYEIELSTVDDRYTAAEARYAKALATAMPRARTRSRPHGS